LSKRICSTHWLGSGLTGWRSMRAAPSDIEAPTHSDR
jgi:hypothetical protein